MQCDGFCHACRNCRNCMSLQSWEGVWVHGAAVLGCGWVGWVVGGATALGWGWGVGGGGVGLGMGEGNYSRIQGPPPLHPPPSTHPSGTRSQVINYQVPGTRSQVITSSQVITWYHVHHLPLIPGTRYQASGSRPSLTLTPPPKKRHPFAFSILCHARAWPLGLENKSTDVCLQAPYYTCNYTLWDLGGDCGWVANARGLDWEREGV